MKRDWKTIGLSTLIMGLIGGCICSIEIANGAESIEEIASQPLPRLWAGGCLLAIAAEAALGGEGPGNKANHIPSAAAGITNDSAQLKNDAFISQLNDARRYYAGHQRRGY